VRIIGIVVYFLGNCMSKKILSIIPETTWYHADRLNELSKYLIVVNVDISAGMGKGWCRHARFKNISFEGNLFHSLWQLYEIVKNEMPDYLMIVGYFSVYSILAAILGKYYGKVNILVSDSRYEDKRRYLIVEWLKRFWVKIFDGIMVAGVASKKYMIGLGCADNIVVEGCNVIDNGYYFNVAQYARQRHVLKAPKYFLSVGQLIHRKNMVRLLKAYDIYSKESKDPWGLIICGDGPQWHKIVRFINEEKISNVVLKGFLQRKELAIVYANAKCFILASLQDTWGMVVNEAMASRLPVLVSRYAGAGIDLVVSGENGYLIDPYSEREMAEKMNQISNMSVRDLEKMSDKSWEIISRWSLGLYAHNLLDVIYRIDH